MQNEIKANIPENKEYPAYFLGLDSGSNSLGWAVTGEDYSVLTKYGKALWGVHLYEDAADCAERREKRTQRKSVRRKAWRLKVLREIFSDEIANCKDPKFFKRLEMSAFMPGEKSKDGIEKTKPFSLFADDDFTDKDYHKAYKTIHHLIKKLMDDPSPHDPRLVYLACSYFMKHRGHFNLNIAKDKVEDILEIEPVLENLKELLQNEYFIKMEIADNEKLKNALLQKRVKDKKAALKKEIEFTDIGEENVLLNKEELINLFSGGSVKIEKLFEKSFDEDKSVKLSDELEKIESELAQLLEDDFELIRACKMLFDFALLCDIMHGHETITDVKVARYDDHKEHLKLLKEIIKKNYPDAYNSFFKDEKDKAGNVTLCRYSLYITKQKQAGAKDGDYYSTFEKAVKNLFGTNPENETEKVILQKLENKKFLPLQTTGDNRVIPYQLEYSDLKKLVKNAEGYLKINGKNILDLFCHKIPYYVGPLYHKTGDEAIDEQRSPHSWVVLKPGMENERILPWNFNDVIDDVKTHKEFIARMLGKCSYLLGEESLPKNSLLYGKFALLNELNNLSIKGERIDKELKLKLYQEFLNEDKPINMTKNRLIKWLAANGIVIEKEELGGTDEGIKTRLNSYYDFKTYFNSGKLTERQVEEIIKHLTVFGDERQPLEKWLEENFKLYDKQDIKHILKLKYKDYGSLSKKLLEDILCDVEGRECSVIQAMEAQVLNLSELVKSENYKFAEQISLLNKAFLEGGKHDLNTVLDERYVSNRVKRQVFRAFAVVNEIEKIMKAPPKKIFIEMARGADDIQNNKRT